MEVIPVPFEDHSPSDLPNFVKKNGGDLVIAYGMGHHVVDFFRQMGMKVVTGAMGRVKDVVNAFIHEVLEIDPYWKEKIEKGKKEGCKGR